MDQTAVISSKSKSPEAKHWAGCTLNNYTEVEEASFIAKIQPLATYYVYGKEVAPTTGTPHLQFMVCFISKKRLTAVKKLLRNDAHWEIKSGNSTFKQASDYCKKDGNFVEWGVLPKEQMVFSFDNYSFLLRIPIHFLLRITIHFLLRIPIHF